MHHLGGIKMKGKKITIKGGYVPQKIENIHEHLQAINQGKGVTKAKKGKGSYARKPKHRSGWNDSGYSSTYFFAVLFI